MAGSKTRTPVASSAAIASTAPQPLAPPPTPEKIFQNRMHAHNPLFLRHARRAPVLQGEARDAGARGEGEGAVSAFERVGARRDGVAGEWGQEYDWEGAGSKGGGGGVLKGMLEICRRVGVRRWRKCMALTAAVATEAVGYTVSENHHCTGDR